MQLNILMMESKFPFLLAALLLALVVSCGPIKSKFNFHDDFKTVEGAIARMDSLVLKIWRMDTNTDYRNRFDGFLFGKEEAVFIEQEPNGLFNSSGELLYPFKLLSTDELKQFQKDASTLKQNYFIGAFMNEEVTFPYQDPYSPVDTTIYTYIIYNPNNGLKKFAEIDRKGRLVLCSEIRLY